MAGYVLHLSTEENITLSSATVKRLIAGGSGDAALLYLAILHARGAADSGKLARELKWDETRLRAAEQALYEMKLVGAPEKKEEAPLPPPQQLSEPPEYTREDIARKLEGDGRSADDRRIDVADERGNFHPLVLFCGAARSRPRRSRSC